MLAPCSKRAYSDLRGEKSRRPKPQWDTNYDAVKLHWHVRVHTCLPSQSEFLDWSTEYCLRVTNRARKSNVNTQLKSKHDTNQLEPWGNGDVRNQLSREKDKARSTSDWTGGGECFPSCLLLFLLPPPKLITIWWNQQTHRRGYSHCYSGSPWWKTDSEFLRVSECFLCSGSKSRQCSRSTAQPSGETLNFHSLHVSDKDHNLWSSESSHLNRCFNLMKDSCSWVGVWSSAKLRRKIKLQSVQQTKTEQTLILKKLERCAKYERKNRIQWFANLFNTTQRQEISCWNWKPYCFVFWK